MLICVFDAGDSAYIGAGHAEKNDVRAFARATGRTLFGDDTRNRCCALMTRRSLSNQWRDLHRQPT